MARRIRRLVPGISWECQERESALSGHHQRGPLDHFARSRPGRSHSNRCALVAHIFRYSVFQRLLAPLGQLQKPHLFTRLHYRHVALFAPGGIRIWRLAAPWPSLPGDGDMGPPDRLFVSAMVRPLSQAIRKPSDGLNLTHLRFHRGSRRSACRWDRRTSRTARSHPQGAGDLGGEFTPVIPRPTAQAFQFSARFFRGLTECEPAQEQDE